MLMTRDEAQKRMAEGPPFSIAEAILMSHAMRKKPRIAKSNEEEYTLRYCVSFYPNARPEDAFDSESGFENREKAKRYARKLADERREDQYITAWKYFPVTNTAKLLSTTRVYSRTLWGSKP